MKKIIITKIIITIVIILVLTMCACTSTQNSDCVSYPLKYVYVADTLTEAPNGEITQIDDTHVRMVIGDYTSDFEINEENQIIINDLPAEISINANSIELFFPEIETKYVFTYENLEQEVITTEETIISSFTGRMYFEETKNDFADYEGRSIALKCNLIDDCYNIYSELYSDSIPLARIKNDGTGTVMDYEVSSQIEEAEGTDEDLNKYADIVDPYEYRPWDAPTDFYSQEETLYKILKISGVCSDAFRFEIVLVEE